MAAILGGESRNPGAIWLEADCAFDSLAGARRRREPLRESVWNQRGRAIGLFKIKRHLDWKADMDTDNKHSDGKAPGSINGDALESGSTPIPEAKRGPLRVLIIDDSRATRLVIRTFMREFGFETEEAPDGLEALKLFTPSKQIDLIVCDWEMPNMSGVEFVRNFRANFPSLQSVPIIMATTLNAAEQIAEALTAGATDYIMKPFTKDIFESKLDLLGIEHK